MKTIKKLEEEKKLLNITLEYIKKENFDLKNKMDDLKQTVIHNKTLLNEYVIKITNKDEVVQKMSNTIDHLFTRLMSCEDYIKVLL